MKETFVCKLTSLKVCYSYKFFVMMIKVCFRLKLQQKLKLNLKYKTLHNQFYHVSTYTQPFQSTK